MDPSRLLDLSNAAYQHRLSSSSSSHNTLFTTFLLSEVSSTLLEDLLMGFQLNPVLIFKKFWNLEFKE
ncbi:hypothetical protein HanPI659440_Chr16g0619041 [Helianthus annuus]|nr:hypothetical protein HanPI659440_Chr16g0619041 [Helianthus annuus]